MASRRTGTSGTITARQCEEATKQAVRQAVRRDRAKRGAAGAIAAQVLVHFGAGYGAERLRENPTGPMPNFQIFCAPADLAGFFDRLVASCLRNAGAIDWGNDQVLRDQACAVAFKHGVAARKAVVAAGASCLDTATLDTTLRNIQATECPAPGGAGGGAICAF